MKITIEVLNTNHQLDSTDQFIMENRLLIALYSTIFKFHKNITLTRFSWER